MQPGAFSAMVNWYRAALQVPSEPPVSFRITMPILVLWGVNDVAIIPDQADQSLTYCDQGKLVKFKKATHWLQHEEADKVNKLMADFFTQQK
jgi:pimeloyl-ACP methyl ester carboxylesterase